MSFDLFFVRPDPSGRTVEQKNPFTGQVGAAPAMLPLAPGDFERLAVHLSAIGIGDPPAPGNLTINAVSDGWDFNLDPEGGSAGLSRVTPDSLAIVLMALIALIDHGYAIFAPGVDSNRPEPLDQQLFKALGLNAHHAGQVRAHLDPTS